MNNDLSINELVLLKLALSKKYSTNDPLVDEANKSELLTEADKLDGEDNIIDLKKNGSFFGLFTDDSMVLLDIADGIKDDKIDLNNLIAGLTKTDIFSGLFKSLLDDKPKVDASKLNESDIVAKAIINAFDANATTVKPSNSNYFAQPVAAPSSGFNYSLQPVNQTGSVPVTNAVPDKPAASGDPTSPASQPNNDPDEPVSGPASVTIPNTPVNTMNEEALSQELDSADNDQYPNIRNNLSRSQHNVDTLQNEIATCQDKLLNNNEIKSKLKEEEKTQLDELSKTIDTNTKAKNAAKTKIKELNNSKNKQNQIVKQADLDIQAAKTSISECDAIITAPTEYEEVDVGNGKKEKDQLTEARR